MAARLIVDMPRPGIWNMAVDEVLLESAADTGRITLRFYFWSEPTLSLGYFQRAGDRVLHPPSVHCPWVRRATGGGAILHDRELTYSFVAPDRGVGGHQALYDAFHETLVELLAGRGILATCQGETVTGGETEPFLCFQRRSRGDVLLGGEKICGSAQRRHRGALLQHGSLLLRRSEYAPELGGVEDGSGQMIEVAGLRDEWMARLKRRLRLDWQEDELSAVESRRAECLQYDKFDAEAWRARRA
ncbi:MAG: hypothetical protein U0935_16650 [Pirellulales bacterium]